MGLNAAGITAFMDDGNEAVVYAAMGSGPTSADQTSAARVLMTSTVAGGVITATNVPMAFTGTPNASTAYTLLYSAPTGGTFYGFDAVTGDQTFNASGVYSLTALTFTGSSPT